MKINTTNPRGWSKRYENHKPVIKTLQNRLSKGEILTVEHEMFMKEVASLIERYSR